MTLIEVMVSLGIASVMMLGILDLVKLSQRSVQNVTTLTDWNNMVNSVAQVLNNPILCQKALQGTIFVPNSFSPVAQISMGTTPIIAAGGNYLDFSINSNAGPPYGIAIECDGPPGGNGCMATAGSTTITNPAPAATYNTYSAYLVINGLKLSTLKAVGGSQLGGDALSNSNPNLGGGKFGIPINLLVTQTAPFTVFSCNGAAATEQTICNGFGGSWDQKTLNCTIGSIQFFSDKLGPGTNPDNPSPPALVTGPYGGPNFVPSNPDNSITGSRIQLWGTSGAPNLTDAAIGIGGVSGVGNPYSGNLDPYMWFNIGGTGGSDFVFHEHSTVNDHYLAQLWDIGGGQAAFMLDPIPWAATKPLSSSAAMFFQGWVPNWLDGGGSSKALGPALAYSGTYPDPYGMGNAFLTYTQDDTTAYLPRTGIDVFGNFNILPNNSYTSSGGMNYWSVLGFNDYSGLSTYTYPTEQIASNRTPGALDMEFYVNNHYLMQLDYSGDVYITPTRNFSVTDVNGDMLELDANSATLLGKTAAVIQAPTTTLKGGTVKSNSYLNLTYSTSGGAGNVPHNCFTYVSRVNNTVSGDLPPNHFLNQFSTANCPASQVLMGGGGSCLYLDATGCNATLDLPQITSSGPNIGGLPAPSAPGVTDTQPYIPAQNANAWTIQCERMTHSIDDLASYNAECGSITKIDASVYAYAVCCDI